MRNTVNMMSDENIKFTEVIREALVGKENCSSVRIYDYIANRLRHRIEFSCEKVISEDDIINALDYIMKKTLYHKNKELQKDFIKKAEALVSVYHEEEITDIEMCEIQRAFYLATVVYDCWIYCQEQNHSITTGLLALKNNIK